MKNLKGELTIMDSLETKPNYAALGRKYGMDWRTVKKYHNGYEGRSSTRNKGSKLDEYRNIIEDKLNIKRLTTKGVYEFLVRKYGVERIGTYSNFSKYVKKNKLKTKVKNEGHPRYERKSGDQAQVDWKEDISIANKYGEIFTINVLHVVLKFSRLSHLEISIRKQFDDVARGLINSFKAFGGVPKELLFDNMSTVANTSVTPKKPTDAIKKLAKDFNFKVRLCRKRKPETKGTVEAKNKVIDWIRAYEGEFETYEELSMILENINKEINIEINQETQMSPLALFYKEKEYLQPLPTASVINEYLTPNKYTVNNDALIKYGQCKYSVSPKLIGEDVAVDVFDNKLYIYYNGKLETFHELIEKPYNYKPEHYAELMKGKAKEEEMERIAKENLAVMDNILEMRHIEVSPLEATKSKEALIAYINQSKYGKWIISRFAHISEDNQLIFIKNMNLLLPYVANNENLLAFLKYSMQENMCKTIDFDCWVHDYMSTRGDDYILTDEGYDFIKNKYAKEVSALLKDIEEKEK